MNKGIFIIVFTIVTVYKTVDSNLKAFCAHNVSSNMSRYSVKPIRIEYLGPVIKINQSEGWIFTFHSDDVSRTARALGDEFVGNGKVRGCSWERVWLVRVRALSDEATSTTQTRMTSK